MDTPKQTVKTLDEEQGVALELAKMETVAEPAKKEKPKTYHVEGTPKVLVATPNYTNTFHAEVYVNHITCETLWKEWGVPHQWMIIGRTFVHFARTQACRAAVDGDFTHIFWVDDDAIIDPEILPRFLSHDKDIVISPYPMRRSPFQIGILSATSYYCRPCKHRQTCGMDVTPPVSMACEKCGQPIPRDFHNHASYRNMGMADMNQGLIDVDGGGTHAMLVKVECLKNARGWPPPKPDKPLEPENRSYPDGAVDVYMKLQSVIDRVEDQNLVDHYIGDMPDQSRTFQEEDEADKPFFSMPKVGTEDMLHCYRARCKGVKIYCDTDVFSSHLGFAPVITKDFVVEMERWLSQHDAKKVPRKERVALMPAGDNSRDHTVMKMGQPASLV